MAVLGTASAFVLGCNSSARTTQPNEQFELKQTNQGQIIRLNKETGEIDIIEAAKRPASTDRWQVALIDAETDANDDA